MARRIRIDRGYETELDQFEQDLFRLKVEYDKYFNGLEKLEPARERDRLRHAIRELEQDIPNNTAQAYHFNTLKARFMSFELYWQRNLVMIERGTHPKFKFRADLREKERRQREAEAAPAGPTPAELERGRKEDRAYHSLYDKYMEARRQCGQKDDLDFDKVREALQKQIALIKEKTGARSVKFRITVEEGKAKVKAVPVH